MILLTGIPQGELAKKEGRFPLYGHQVSVAPEIVSYNYIRRQFHLLAEQAAKHFESQYNQQITSLDKLMEHATELFAESMEPVWQACIEALIQCHITHIDLAYFVLHYQEWYDCWSPAFDNIADQYAKIVCTQQELDEYRKQRRENRSRLVGGGFGIEGAVKGMIAAETVNMAFGAAHMIFNGLGKIGSSIVASGQKDKIFQDHHTLFSLKEAVRNSALACHHALISCLNEEAHTHFLVGIPSEQQEQAKSILHNLQSGLIPDNMKWDAIQSSFACWPYQSQWYKYMLGQFDDRKGELDVVADYFHVVIYGYKWQYVDAALGKINTTSMESAQSELQRLEPIMAQYHYFGETPKKTRILEAIKKFDLQQRTIPIGTSGKHTLTLKTVEDAALAKVQLKETEQALQAYSDTNETACHQALDCLNAMDLLPEVKTLFVQFYEKRCQEFEKQACTVFGKEYDSREKAASVKANYEQIKQQLSISPSIARVPALKERIRTGEFPQAIQDELNALVYEVENKPELTKVRSINFVAVLLLVAILIAGWVWPVSATGELHNMHVTSDGIELLIHNHVIKDNLSFLDGIKNPIAIFSKSIIGAISVFFANIIDIFINIFAGRKISEVLLYKLQLIGSDLWLDIRRYFVSLWYTFRQSSNLAYCAGYLLATVTSWFSVLRLATGEKKQVQKLKNQKGGRS